jgi:hypothetical protein
VKGLAFRNSWWGKEKPARERLFYVCVLVARSRNLDEFFVMTQTNRNGLVRDYQDRHLGRKKVAGFVWKDAERFNDRLGRVA